MLFKKKTREEREKKDDETIDQVSANISSFYALIHCHTMLKSYSFHFKTSTTHSTTLHLLIGAVVGAPVCTLERSSTKPLQYVKSSRSLLDKFSFSFTTVAEASANDEATPNTTKANKRPFRYAKEFIVKFEKNSSSDSSGQ
jgi:hypothetical protein